MTKIWKILIVTINLSVFCGPTMATGLKDAKILSGWLTSDGKYQTALSLKLSPGWKTYWRQPGLAGIAPQFDFSDSQNVADIDIQWPTPVIFGQSTSQSIGYKEKVIFPITVTPQDINKNIILRLNADIGICADVCIPQTFSLHSELNINDTQKNTSILAALLSLPLSGSDAGLLPTECYFAPIQEGLKLSINVQGKAIGKNAVVVIETNQPDHWTTPTQIEHKKNGFSAQLNVMSQTNSPVTINRSHIVTTIIDDSTVIEVVGCTP